MVCVNDIFEQIIYLMVSLGLIWKCWRNWITWNFINSFTISQDSAIFCIFVGLGIVCAEIVLPATVLI